MFAPQKHNSEKIKMTNDCPYHKGECSVTANTPKANKNSAFYQCLCCSEKTYVRCNEYQVLSRKNLEKEVTKK